jgi:hypothetical protein
MVNYSYTDTDPFIGLNYYRLKQVDFDGAFEYSNILAVNMTVIGNEAGTVTAGPNPFTDNINVDYVSIIEGVVDVNIYDMSGRVVKTKKVEASSGLNTFSVLDNRDLPTGIYLLGVIRENKSTPLIKLIKN